MHEILEIENTFGVWRFLSFSLLVLENTFAGKNLR